MKTLAYIATILLIASESGANPLDRPAAEEVPAPAPNASSHIPAFIRNPGFEATTGDLPDDWAMFREAFLDTNPALAHSGVASIRASFGFGWGQSIELPAYPLESIGIGGYAQSEFAFESGRIRFVYRDGSGNQVAESSVILALPDHPQYSHFLAVSPTPAGAESVDFFPGGASEQSWVRYDDFSLFTEQYQFAGSLVGGNWEFTGTGGETSGGLLLPAGAVATQYVVGGRSTQGYFIAGTFATTSPATLQVTEEWLPTSAFESTATVSGGTMLAPPGGDFIIDLGRPAAVGGRRVASAIAHNAPDTLEISNLTRGFAAVEPSALTAGPGSPDTLLLLTGAWPGNLTTASIEILRADNSVAAFLSPEALGTSFRANYDGGAEPSGSYAARFTMNGTGGPTVVVTRPFDIIRDDSSTSTLTRYSEGRFVRGAYVFSFFDEANDRITSAIQLARNDGFNFLFFHGRDDQLESARAAAEDAGLPFVPVLDSVRRPYSAALARGLFSRDEYTSTLSAVLAPVTTSPMYRGAYVVDEPVGSAALDMARRANIAIQQSGTLGAGFSIWTEGATPAEIIEYKPPAVLIDLYPYLNFGSASNTTGLLESVPRILEWVEAADSVDRELWMVPQAFEARDRVTNYRPVPQSVHTGQLAAAVMGGAKGVVPFLYTPASTIEAMRGPNLEETAKLQAYREFNNVMDRLSTTVWELQLPEIVPSVDAPFAATTALHPVEGRHALVLNADDSATRTAHLTLSPSAAGTYFDLVAERPLFLDGTGRIEVPLGPGQWVMTAIGTATVTSVESGTPALPEQTDFDLQVTHQFTATRPGGAPDPVKDVRLSTDGSVVAVSAGAFLTELAAPHVYDLGPGGAVTRRTGPLQYLNDSADVLVGPLAMQASRVVGLRAYPLGNLAGTPVHEFTGYSGGVYRALPDGNRFWTTGLGFGIRQLEVQGATLVPQAAETSSYGEYSDLHGPFQDGRVTVVVRDRGLSNIQPNALAEALHTTASIPRILPGSSMNANRMLAAPRLGRGFVLVQLAATGEPVWLQEVIDDCVDPTATTWLTNGVLAVADGLRAIRFYRIGPGQTVEFAGVWRPEGAGDIYFTALDAEAGRLAAGCEDGRVFIVDTSQVPELQTSASSWWLLH